MTATRAQLLVAGASGKLGRRTAELLLATGAATELILVTRTPGAVADLGERGCDVRFGDYSEPDSLPDAYAGAERMLLISASDIEIRSEQHRAAIRAAAAVGVRHIVYTSGLNPEPPNPAVVAPSHHATELALVESGLSWTMLRDSLYSEYQVPEATQAIASGRLTHNRGTGEVAYVSRDDCAAVAAAVVAGPGHERCVYDVTGSESFTPSDLALLYGELGGRNVDIEELDDRDVRRASFRATRGRMTTRATARNSWHLSAGRSGRGTWQAEAMSSRGWRVALHGRCAPCSRMPAGRVVVA